MSTPQIAIIGAGLSGLCMGIALKRAGIESFTILEKADRVGGTWRENTYPGVACDVPSHLYSYSFELNPDWTRVYSPGREIQAYIERCTDKYALRPHLRFGVEVRHLEFVGGRWRIEVAAGEVLHADVVVGALGGLHEPRIPPLPGLSSFAGTHFHSARWQHDHDLTGRRVAVIGSAASAVQIVPEVAKVAERLLVFQRTPNWILPRNDGPYPPAARERFRRNRLFARGVRWLIYGFLEATFRAFRPGSRLSEKRRQQCLQHLHAQVVDPELRRKLTPDYVPGCKRILLSDDFYPALTRENVDLVTSGIQRIVPEGIVTEDGQTHRVDTIVLATGFEPMHFLHGVDVVGSGGMTLAQAWKDRIDTHRTIAAPGFPNFFMLLGPNSGLGHNSIIFMIEAPVRYIVQAVQAMQSRGLAQLSPRTEAAASFNREMRARMQRTVWSEGGCKSWYQDANGNIFTLWPGSTLRYWWQMRRLRLSEYLQVKS